MIREKMVGLGVWVVSALMMGCANPAKKAVDEKLKEEPDYTSRSDLREHVTLEIESATNLTTEQKQKLHELGRRVQPEVARLSEESLKLRGLLISELIRSDYNDREVEVVKKRLEKIDHDRLALMFRSVDDAKKILGRKAALNENLLRIFEEMPRGGD